jgi:two-component SAPR family response regulator
MRAIAVDDELYMLEALAEAVSASADIEVVKSFSSCSAALAYVEENPVDVAFLDIHMRGIGGLRLAERITEHQPKCKIVFCTGYKEYAVAAFQIHASGYLIKPITAEAVQKEIDHIKNVDNAKRLLTVKCFGNFEVLYNGAILPFKRTKTKEILAVLVDRSGSGMTARQICAILFPDDTVDAKNLAYLRQLIFDLKNTLREVGADSVLQHESPYYRIDPDKMQCDYLSYLETGKPEFHGEYMMQYSWAEETCAMLHFKK